MLLVAALLAAGAGADISSVDVFVHGEHPLCPCLRIPSVVSTDHTLYAFAECRPWLGDGCDPLGVHSQSGAVHIAMKSSATGGSSWSPLVILTEGCQPTAVWDERSVRRFHPTPPHHTCPAAGMVAAGGHEPGVLVGVVLEHKQQRVLPSTRSGCPAEETDGARVLGRTRCCSCSRTTPTRTPGS